MSDFGELFHPKARKQHRCEFCLGPIPKGEVHCQYKGIWEGDWQNWRMHDECYEDYTLNWDWQDGFMPGDGEMPERIKLLVKPLDTVSATGVV
jgi:hypothetical protein